MFALAKELAEKGHSVITTTSTKIRYPKKEQSGNISIGYFPKKLEKGQHITIAKEVSDIKHKLVGYSAEEIDKVYESNVADYILVEADGSAGRSIKAHADHEPVVSKKAHLVIAVVGIDCLGKPINDENVHRAELFCKILQREPGSLITGDDIDKILFHPKGYFKNTGKNSDRGIFISKVKSEEEKSHAKALIESLQDSRPSQQLRIFADNLCSDKDSL